MALSTAARGQPSPALARTRVPIGNVAQAILLGLCLFFLIAAGWFSLPKDPTANPLIIAGIWMNIAVLLVAIGIAASRHTYSLHLMHLVAMLLFLGAASLFQYSVGYLGVAGMIGGVQRQVPIALASVSLWLVGYLAGYEAQRAFGRRRPGPVLRLLQRDVSPMRAAFVLALALATLAYLAALGLAGASTRAAALDTMSEYTLEGGAGGYSLPFYLIHAMLLRAFSPFALLVGILVLTRSRRSFRPFLLSLVGLVAIGTLIANNPFAASRMWFATTLIAFSAPFVLRRLRTGYGLVLIAVGGIAFLPALHESRFTETFDEFLDYARVASPLQYLSRNSDVDSLGMLSLCQQWVDLRDHRYGMQTLGSFLYWFPRTLWPNKPIETGAMVTEGLGFEFTNLAPPIMADALVDFGLLGVPVVAVLFGLLLARIDRAYWERGTTPQIQVIDCIYPFWLGAVLFLTRGGSFAALTFLGSFTFWILPLAIPKARRPQTVTARDAAQVKEFQ